LSIVTTARCFLPRTSTYANLERPDNESVTNRATGFASSGQKRVLTTGSQSRRPTCFKAHQINPTNEKEENLRVQRIILIGTVVAFSQSACAPLPISYLRPSAQGGELEARRENCGGPRDRIVFKAPQYDWVEFAVSAIRDESGRIKVSFDISKRIPFVQHYTFFGYEGGVEGGKKNDEMVTRTIVIASSAPAIKVIAKSGPILLDLRLLDTTPKSSLPGYESVIVDGLMDPSGFVTLKGRNWIHQNWVLSTEADSAFDLEMPHLTVDEISFQMPLIHFEPASGIFAFGANC